MIQREWKTVTVNTYSNTPDSYGQLHTTISSTRTIKMVTKIYNQKNVNNPIYDEVELIGITKDNNVNINNEIVLNNTNHIVLYVIPSGRYNQVLMKRV